MKPQPAAQPTNTTGTPGLIFMRAAWHHLLDFVFPPRCVNCGRVDTSWCAHCHEALAAIPIRLRRISHTRFSEVAASGPHTDALQNAVIALKYYGAVSMAQPLGQRIAAVIHELGWDADALVPVPLSDQRLKERGYNQSELIAAAAGQRLGMSYIASAIQRQRHTRPQVGLTTSERLENVSEAFHANASQLAGQRIVLVDDVYTTGATLSSCADVALAAGARAVYGLTVTHAGSSTI